MVKIFFMVKIKKVSPTNAAIFREAHITYNGLEQDFYPQKFNFIFNFSLIKTYSYARMDILIKRRISIGMRFSEKLKVELRLC
jgi:hypothetical protein